MILQSVGNYLPNDVV